MRTGRIVVWGGILTMAALGGCRRPSAENGEAIFRKNCGGCHSMRADRVTDAPILRGYFMREPRPNIRDTRREILDGRQSMPPFRGRLSSGDVDDLIAFLEAWQ